MKISRDYHENIISDTSSDVSDDMLVYDWSGVVSIYLLESQDNVVFTAEINTEHMRTETKAPRGRPLHSWDFIFSPDKFDREIGLDQFSKDGLPLQELQHNGIKASFIRQVLIERAQVVTEPFQYDEEANKQYS